MSQSALGLAIKSEFEEKDDNIYVNVVLTNNSNKSVPCISTQTLTSAIIDKPSDYYFAVAKFSMDGASIPIFNFVNNAYWVTIGYNGYYATYPVVYVPYDFNRPDQSVYSYQEFINEINNALTLAFNDASANASGWPGGASAAPYMIYSPRAGGLCSLLAQTAYDSTASTPIQIFMNTTLYYFFDNMLVKFLGEGLSTYRDFQILVQDLHNNTTAIDPSIPSGYYRMDQEYPRLYSWWDTESIVFKSSLIGVREEYVPTTNISSSLVGANTAGSGTSQASNLTDFTASFPITDPGGYRSQLVYFPPFYRLIDLLSNNVRGIDISVYWVDKTNTQRIYYIPPNQTVSMKFAFLKKSLYKNSLMRISNPDAEKKGSSFGRR
jgi:hypothetical protein